MRDHNCSDCVQLHVVQEMMEILQLSDDTNVDTHSHTSMQDQLFLTLSLAAISGAPFPRTICLQGDLQNNSIRILLDSGSSHTFVSAQFATNLPNWKPLAKPIGVKVADGGILQCTHEVQLYDWLVQGVQFRIPSRNCPLSVMVPSWVWIG